MKLPEVSLVVVETICHELAQATVDDFLAKVEPKEVLIFTDRPDKLSVNGATARTIPNWDNKNVHGMFCNSGIAEYVNTPAVLFVEWDAGICDAAMWDNSWLQFDYLGSPWWYTDGSPNVGNGGFSLRSKRLIDFLAQNTTKYPVRTDNELCRDFGPKIIADGNFNWAPVPIANDFAFEGFGRLGLPDTLLHFGFHWCVNWRFVLEKDELIRRAKMMHANKYCAGRLLELMNCLPTWMQEEIRT